MDLLARLSPSAQDLLGRVDATLLAGGAPADHPVWPLLRRLGALPGDLVAQLSAATAEALRPAGDPLRAMARSYVDGPDLMPGTAGWRGAAAESFGAQWHALAGYLSGGPDSMASRLREMASYVDEVAAWLAGTRDAVAVAVAECLGSVEAATLRGLPAGGLGSGVAGLASTWLAVFPAGAGRPGSGVGAGAIGTGGPGAAIRAAATIGAHVLRAAAGALDEGDALRARWAGRLDELPYRPASAPGPTSAGHLALPG